MRIPRTRAALTRFEHKRGQFGLEPTLPEDPGRVHAISRATLLMPSSDAVFASKDINFDDVPVGTFCGRKGWVILPFEFNNSDPDACLDCVRMAKLYAEDFSAWFVEYQRRENKSMY